MCFLNAGGFGFTSYCMQQRNVEEVRLIREKGEGQKRFNQRKKEVKLDSDFEVLINAKAAKLVCVCMLIITGVDSIHPP